MNTLDETQLLVLGETLLNKMKVKNNIILIIGLIIILSCVLLFLNIINLYFFYFIDIVFILLYIYTKFSYNKNYRMLKQIIQKLNN